MRRLRGVQVSHGWDINDDREGTKHGTLVNNHLVICTAFFLLQIPYVTKGRDRQGRWARPKNIGSGLGLDVFSAFEPYVSWGGE